MRKLFSARVYTRLNGTFNISYSPLTHNNESIQTREILTAKPGKVDNFTTDCTYMRYGVHSKEIYKT